MSNNKNGCCSDCECDDITVSCDFELLNDDTWFYVNIQEDCKTRFIEFSLNCFRDYVVQSIPSYTQITDTMLALQNQVTALSDEITNLQNQLDNLGTDNNEGEEPDA